VALFTTASPELEEQLRAGLARHGVDVVFVSPHLASRSALRRDLARAKTERCDLYLTELKAAAIEVVAEDAERRGVDVVFVRNRPVALEGEPDLDAALLELLERAPAVRGGVARAAGR
jgi:cyclic 2,3-diphosphoglycerate synthetase